MSKAKIVTRRRKIKFFFLDKLHILRNAIRKFIKDGIFLKAQALSYSSFLASIPLAFVALSIIPSRLFLGPLREKIKAMLLRIFVPQAALKISVYLDEFLKNAQSLGFIGVISFIFTSIMFLETVDKALGDIWGVRKKSLLIRLALFWAFITIPPILMGVSIYLNYLIRSKIAFHFNEILYLPMVYALSAVVFTLIYAVFPSADVKFRYALIGGLVAAILWHLAKMLFNFYIYRAIMYRTIYGSLWLVPIFIFWMFIVWSIVLFGAELTYVLQWPAGRGKRSLYRILLLLRGLYLNLLEGQKALEKEQAMRICGIERSEFEAVLREMEKKGWILECEDGISLSRLPDRIPLHEVLSLSNAFEKGWDSDLNRLVEAIENAVAEGTAQLTIGQLFEEVCGIPCKHGTARHRTAESQGHA